MASSDYKGLLSFIGDPLGKALGWTLSPLGHVIGKIGNPNGEAALNVKRQMKEELAYSGENQPLKERPGGELIGGKAQTGMNPLGL